MCCQYLFFCADWGDRATGDGGDNHFSRTQKKSRLFRYESIYLNWLLPVCGCRFFYGWPKPFLMSCEYWPVISITWHLMQPSFGSHSKSFTFKCEYQWIGDESICHLTEKWKWKKKTKSRSAAIFINIALARTAATPCSTAAHRVHDRIDFMCDFFNDYFFVCS